MKKGKQTSVKQMRGVEGKTEKDCKKAHTFCWPLGLNAREVCLAGDFNKWKPEPMEKGEKGFQTTVKLETGVYQYKFLIDGEWQADPSATGSAINVFGTANSVLRVE